MIRLYAPRATFDADGRGGGGGDLDLRSLGDAIERHAKATESALADIKQRTIDNSARVRQVEIVAAGMGASDGTSRNGSAAADALSREIAGNDAFKAVVGRRADKAMVPVSSRHFLEVRNTITSVVSGDPITPSLAPQRLPGIFFGPERRSWLHQLMPAVPATGGSVEYVRESAFDNNATAQSSEGATKAQSAITLQLQESKVATIAHWIKASRQALSDSNALREYLDQRLRLGTLLSLEAQLIAGDGASGRIKGLTHADNHIAYSGGMGTDQAVDTIRRAIGQLEASDFSADVVLLHPEDWTDMELMKDGENRYLIGDPKAPSSRLVWNHLVHTSTAMPAGSFIVAALGQATQFHPREDAQLLIALDGDDLTKNLVTLLAELRATMTVPLPGGVILGELPSFS